ncbi:hypothetical protein FB107DRAFT_277236 [Schizophyllum commune]
MPHEHEFTSVQSPLRKVRKTRDGNEVPTSATNAHSQTGALFEILAHLNLTSLFRLSETSHALRGTLLSPSATWIWLNSGAKILTGATAVIPEDARQKALEEVLPPPVKDLAIREFFSLLFDDVCDGTPIEEEVSEEDVRALVDNLAWAGRFFGWRAACEDALVAMLNAADPGRARPATTADLALATTVFSQTPDTGREDVRRIVIERAWAADEFCVNVRYSGLAARVVSMAGLDPATATVEDMDRLDLWFSQTEDVVDGDLERQMMRWRDAVRSLLPLPSEEEELFLLSDEEVKEGHILQQLVRLLELEGLEAVQSRLNSLSS